MSDSIDSRNQWDAPRGGTRHLIDSALFGLTFDNAARHCPDELELARIVETELLQVVDTVFDERSRSSGAVCIDRLEVDLGSFAFDGSWSQLRERLREALQAALARTRPVSAAAPGDEPGVAGTATGFELLAYFLRFGLLPSQAQVANRSGIDRLLQAAARAEPQRVAALIRADGVGGATAARLAKQFPEVLVRQIAAALGLEELPAIKRPAALVGAPAAHSHQATARTGGAAGDAGAVLAHSAEAADLRVGAVPSSANGLDQMRRALEHGQPQRLEELLRQLQSGAVALADLVDSLSTAGHRRLLAGIVAAATLDAGAGAELRRAIDRYAQQAGSERDFYRQIIARLVRGELIDVEAIAARSSEPDRQSDAGRRSGVQVDAARSAIEPTPGSARLFRAYDLYAVLVAPDQERVSGQDPADAAIDELARDHPQQFRRLLSELRSGVVRLPPIAARLSETGIGRLIEAFVKSAAGSADADRSQFLQSVDNYARLAGSARAFRLRVLQRLVDGELVDLDALAEKSLSAPAQPNEPDRYPERRAQPESPEAVESIQATGTALTHPESRAALQALGSYLDGGAALTGADLAQLRRSVEQLLGADPQRLAECLRPALTEAGAISRLLELLPERLLTRLLYLLAPADHERMQRCADAVVNLCSASQTAVAPAQLTGLKWRFLFRHLPAAESQWNADRLVRRCAEFLAAHSSAAAADPDAAPRSAADAKQFVRSLLQSFKREGESVGLTEPEPPGDERQTTAAAELKALLERGIHIANAGQVLAAPYLPRLFALLGLIEDGVFKTPELRARAVHLLQFLVDESGDTPEYGLALNKILCGLDRMGTVDRAILVSDAEKEAINGLLRGMIQNWQVLKRTSVAGFRESFLQRQGRLRLNHDGWHLAVEPKPFDMLLDRIPWSFSIIKLPWMREVLYVDWR